jgi:hypothetical protein
MPRYFILVVLLLLFSCRDLVENTPASIEPRPVLNSLIKAGNPISAHISLTSGMDTLPLTGLKDAIVELFVDDEFAEILHSAEVGWFISSVVAQAGKSYSLRLQIPGHEMVTASTTIPQPFALLNINHIAIAGKERHGDTHPAVHFTFENNPEIELFYEVHIRLFKYKYVSSAELRAIVDPVLLNEGIPLLLFSNQLMTDDHYTMKVNYTTGSHSGVDGRLVTNLYPFVVELRSVSKDYYLFTRQKHLYETGRFPEFGLGANIAFPLYSNVEDGYGIVAGFSSVVSDTIYPSY